MQEDAGQVELDLETNIDVGPIYLYVQAKLAEFNIETGED